MFGADPAVAPEFEVVTCRDLAFHNLWHCDDCCPDCHHGEGGCGSLIACFVQLTEAVEMEVCCAVLESLGSPQSVRRIAQDEARAISA